MLEKTVERKTFFFFLGVGKSSDLFRERRGTSLSSRRGGAEINQKCTAQDTKTYQINGKENPRREIQKKVWSVFLGGKPYCKQITSASRIFARENGVSRFSSSSVVTFTLDFSLCQFPSDKRGAATLAFITCCVGIYKYGSVCVVWCCRETGKDESVSDFSWKKRTTPYINRQTDPHEDRKTS